MSRWQAFKDAFLGGDKAPAAPASAPGEAAPSPSSAPSSAADAPEPVATAPVPEVATAAEPEVATTAGAELSATEAASLGEVAHPSLPAGSTLYGATKVFPDYQAEPGEQYFTLVHGIAHESSVSFVAILQAIRAHRKGFASSIYFYGPGAMNCLATRGFPTTGDSAFPGEQNINGQLATLIAEGGKVYCCRFGLSLHGFRESDLIAGVIPTHPLDVQDALIQHANAGAIINSTYQV